MLKAGDLSLNHVFPGANCLTIVEIINDMSTDMDLK